MTESELKQYEENVKKYKEALKAVYQDSAVSPLERQKLDSLRLELGLPEADCKNYESAFSACIVEDTEEKKKDTIFRRLMHLHHCELFDNDNWLTPEIIDYTSLSYIELDNIFDEYNKPLYVELTDAEYTGLNEYYAVSIGQSFKDLLDEYGENNIYDAVKDGKLEVFDTQTEQHSFICTKFNLLSREDFQKEYLEPLTVLNLMQYFERLEKEGYDLGLLSPSGYIAYDLFDTLASDINYDDNLSVFMLKTPVDTEKNITWVEQDYSGSEPYGFNELFPDEVGTYLRNRNDDKELSLSPKLPKGFIKELIDGLEKGSDKTYFLPVDFTYKINVPDSLWLKNNNIAQELVDRISAVFAHESEELVDNRFNNDSLKEEITFRHYIAVRNNVNYLNFPYEEAKAYITAAVGQAVQDIVPKELRKQGVIITFDEIDARVPSVFHEGRQRIELTPYWFNYYSESEEDFAKSLSLESLRLFHSSVAHEVEVFQQDKAAFYMKLEEYPYIRKYLEDVTVNRDKLSIEESLTAALLEQKPSESLKLYFMDKSNGDILMLENEGNISWNYQHFDKDFNLIDSDIWNNERNIELPAVVNECAYQCGIEWKNLQNITEETYDLSRKQPAEIERKNDITLSIPADIIVPYLPSSRHRNEKTIIEKIDIPVTIKNLSEKDFPLAFRVTDHKSQMDGISSYEEYKNLSEEERKLREIDDFKLCTDEIRMFNGKFYMAEHVNIHGSLRSDKIESSPDFIKNNLSRSVDSVPSWHDDREHFDKDKSIVNTEARQKNIDELSEQVKNSSQYFVMFNGQVWKECGEPYYYLNYFGLSNEPGAFIGFKRDYSEQSLENFEKDKINKNTFSAFHKEFWNEKYKKAELASKHSINQSTELIPDRPEHIEVLMPEAVRFKDFIDLAELKKQNMTIEEVLQENKIEETEPLARTPEEARDVFVKLTKDVLSLQPVKNIKFATKMVLSSFTPETKDLLNQYFDKSNIKSAAAFDKFFEETFDVKHEHKDPSIVLPSAAKKEPEINKPSPSRHISREHDVGFTR